MKRSKPGVHSLEKKRKDAKERDKSIAECFNGHLKKKVSIWVSVAVIKSHNSFPLATAHTFFKNKKVAFIFALNVIT